MREEDELHRQTGKTKMKGSQNQHPATKRVGKRWKQIIHSTAILFGQKVNSTLVRTREGAK